MANNEKKNAPSLGKIIIAIIVIALANSEMAGPLILMAIFGGMGWIILRAFAKSFKSGKPQPHQSQPLDDCPKPVCFHKDKGVHHVLTGRGRDPWDNPKREIDPWDRPDIDIRKYQRR